MSSHSSMTLAVLDEHKSTTETEAESLSRRQEVSGSNPSKLGILKIFLENETRESGGAYYQSLVSVSHSTFL